MGKSSQGRKSGNSKSKKWLGINPWIIISGAIALLLIIFLVPMFPTTKVIEVNDTIVQTVQKQVPVTVTEDVPTKVYVGYMQEQGQGYAVYTPPIIIIGGGTAGDVGGSSGYGASADRSPYFGPSYGPYYNPYGNSGRRYQVDVSDEIVDFQQANGPDGSLTITLTNASGKQTVYRYIDQYDLTKTGEIKIPTTVTRTRTVSEQQLKQVTKQQVLDIRVNLVHIIKWRLGPQRQREAVVQFLKQTNTIANSLKETFDSSSILADMQSGDANRFVSALDKVNQEITAVQNQISAITPTADIAELADLKYAELKALSAVSSVLQQLGTAVQNRNLAQIEEVGTKWQQLESDPDMKKADEIIRSLLLKYNIIDSEVSYHR